MNPYLDEEKNKFEKAIDHVKQNISALRTGRATPALVENIVVEAYGSKMPLQQLASITAPEPKMILIQPWDKTVIKDVEKAIVAANIGLNPVNEGTALRIKLPPLTEENRKELVKLLKQKIEEGKQSVRHIRDEIREEIIKAEKEKKMSEDEKFRAQRELDEFSQKVNEQITKIFEEKEKEIMTI